jgi:hypothetical protein
MWLPSWLAPDHKTLPTCKDNGPAIKKVAQFAELCRKIARVRWLFDQHRNVPKRVEVRELNERAMVKLARERKHLTDIIKMLLISPERSACATAASIRACRSRGANPGA